MLQRKDVANPPYGNANIALVSSLPYHLSRWVGELMRIVEGDHNRMRAVNRGDIPAPHVARSEEKAIADPAEDVVFDAGSLSFVQDWVEGGDGGADATTEGELDRQGPRQSNPNRRLGVGAQPKKPKQERSEPNALEKKLLRKRQRQQQSDAIAGEMRAHGVEDSIGGEEGESKTAIFKTKNKKRERKQPASLPEKDARPGVAGGGENKSFREDKGGGPASGGGEGEAVGNAGDDDLGPGEKHGRKRKTKRKKRKAAVKEVDEGAEDGVGIPQLSAAAAATPTAAAEGNPPAEAAAEEADGGNPEDPEQGTKKQRRGWGKARSKTAAQAGSERVGMADAAVEGAAWERRSRKKVRSKQKNIRKDKRPVGERPAYLRAGDPEFCGRGLTDETRKFLGLPQDGFGSTPPAGWGQPGEIGESPGTLLDRSRSWVVDKKPTLIPEHSVSRDEGSGGGEPDSGVAVELTREVAHVARAPPLGKSKYKNLAMPPGKKSKVVKVSAKKRRRAIAEG